MIMCTFVTEIIESLVVPTRGVGDPRPLLMLLQLLTVNGLAAFHTIRRYLESYVISSMCVPGSKETPHTWTSVATL